MDQRQISLNVGRKDLAERARPDPGQWRVTPGCSVVLMFSFNVGLEEGARREIGQIRWAVETGVYLGFKISLSLDLGCLFSLRYRSEVDERGGHWEIERESKRERQRETERETERDRNREREGRWEKVAWIVYPFMQYTLSHVNLGTYNLSHVSLGFISSCVSSMIDPLND